MKKATDRALEILDARWPASEPISPRIRNLLGVLIDDAALVERDARLAKITEMCLAIGDRLKALGVVCNDLELVREIAEGKRDPHTFALASPEKAAPDAEGDIALSAGRPEHPESDLRERAERLIPDCYQRPKFVEAAIVELVAIRAEARAEAKAEDQAEGY